jgi:hypothetical protein
MSIEIPSETARRDPSDAQAFKLQRRKTRQLRLF